MKALIQALIGGLVLATAATAAEPAEKAKPHHLSDFVCQDHVCGPEADFKKSDTKLTVIYFWGIRCAPCMLTLPKLVEYDQKFRDKGLAVVGIHAASGEADAIRKVCKAKKVKFPIYRNCKTPPKFKLGMLPIVLMFDGDGKLVFDGHYSLISKEIESRFKKGS